MDAEATARAVEGSEIAYLTVGLPMPSELWEQKFPTTMANTSAACPKHGSELVFFDNTYRANKPTGRPSSHSPSLVAF